MKSEALMAAIQAAHAAIAEHPDPQAVVLITQALHLLVKVQQMDMQNQQQGGPQGQGQQQGDFRPPGDMQDPRGALLAQLGAGG